MVKEFQGSVNETASIDYQEKYGFDGNKQHKANQFCLHVYSQRMRPASRLLRKKQKVSKMKRSFFMRKLLIIFKQSNGMNLFHNF